MEEFYASLFCVRYWPCSGDSFVGCSVTIDVFLVVKKNYNSGPSRNSFSSRHNGTKGVALIERSTCNADAQQTN